MEETVFPPSPTWFLPKIVASREDGSVAYGSKNNIVILSAPTDKIFEPLIISNAHDLRVTAVAFSPSHCSESLQNTIVSCSDDGLVKLWKINTLTASIGHKSHWEQKEALGKIICLDWSIANPHLVVSLADNSSLVLWDVLSNTTTKFSFQKIGGTAISCCPHNEKIVAVGAKSGLISIISLTGNGEKLYRLRGHDNEIQSLTWCPIPYNIFKTNQIYEEFLLASVCQNKEIFIWRAGSDGKCEIKIHIPSSSISKRDNDRLKLGNSFSFSTLFWSDAYTIYSTSAFGELIFFDIKSYLSNKNVSNGTSVQKLNKQSLNSFKLGHCFHSKGLFAIAGTPLQGEIVTYEKLTVKSELKFKIESNKINITENLSSESECERNCKWELVTPKTSSLLWTAGQDKKLVACKLSSSQLEMVFNLHTVNGGVYCAVVSPHDPNKIAIAVGDGAIRLWNLTEPSGEVQMYWQKIRDRVLSLAWHPTKDGVLAYGTSEGRVGLINTNTNKLPSVFKPSHPHSIYNLSWGPQFPSEGAGDGNSEFDLYSVGDYTLSLYNPSKLNADPINLSKIIQFPCKKQTDVSWKPDYSLMAVGNEDGSICLVEPSEFKIVYNLLAYKKLIEAIAWHPPSTSLDSGLSPYHGYFTSGSTDNDNEVRVFNCLKEENEVKVEQVATLKGHYGHIQSVAWSPHIGGRLVSTSADCSVQIWDVIAQCPLVNFTTNKMPLFSVWSPIDSDIIFTGCRNSILFVWRTSSQSKTTPSSIAKKKKRKVDTSSQMIVAKEVVQGNEVAERVDQNEVDKSVEMAEAKVANKNVKEVKMFSKAWIGDVNDKLKNCYSLLKEERKESNGLHYSLPFLSGEEDFKNLIKTEEEFNRKANNWKECYELSLWNGDIKDVLEEKIKTGQLNDYLVSLAPTISPRLWQEACLSYSKSLAERKLFRKAASYLIVCHQIYEAIKLLADANLYLEALCIAKSRLPKSDPVTSDIIKQYAEWLFRNGSFLNACECYIYLGDYLEVAKICGKKSQPEYSSLAALAARKCGSLDLESQQATNAILQCFQLNNFELARRVCDDHDNLKHLNLLYNMYNTIRLLDAGELTLEKDILAYIRESYEVEGVTFPSSLQQLYNKYTFYKNKRQMFITVAQELSFAICAQDPERSVTHVIKALSTCYRYIQSVENEVHPLYKLCLWLSPSGSLSESCYLKSTDDNLVPKIKSVKAFFCAAIIRNLNDSLSAENVEKYLKLINELKDDLLDEENYKYFKNLIDIEIYEKRLLTNRNKAARSKLMNGRENENGQTDAISVNGSFHRDRNTQNGEVNGSVERALTPKSEVDDADGIAENLDTSLREVNEENGNEIDSCGDVNSEDSKIVLDDAKCNVIETDLEEKIVEDTELLNRLKVAVDSFESLRISCPNPIPTYFMFKKLCDVLPECETTKILVDDLERKWQNLN